jgi:nucleoid-associated protein YgaU
MRRVAAALLALAAGGCAGAASQAPPTPPVAQAPAPAAPAPAVVAPTPPPPSPRQELTARHRERALALEHDGNLRRALDQWKIALTVDPDDAAARAGRRALEARIETEVAERVAAGRAALARGSHAEARRQLLSALALDPSSRAAFDLLQNEVKDVESISYTVKANDTLASIAQHYYGDRSRLEVIWETNQLPPNPKLTPGMVLKIPEIPGVPFNRPETRREPPPPRADLPPAPGPPPAPARPERDEAPPEVNPLLVEAREALERREYATALVDVDRFLAGNPNHRDGLEVKKGALYGQARAQLGQKQYDASYRTLEQLARLQPDYQDAPRLREQARARVVEWHYGEGIRLYREEKLRDAIAEWRVVLEVDPQHANAKRNIEQAERLLRGLDERKKR